MGRLKHGVYVVLECFPGIFRSDFRGFPLWWQTCTFCKLKWEVSDVERRRWSGKNLYRLKSNLATKHGVENSLLVMDLPTTGSCLFVAQITPMFPTLWRRLCFFCTRAFRSRSEVSVGSSYRRVKSVPYSNVCLARLICHSRIQFCCTLHSKNLPKLFFCILKHCKKSWWLNGLVNL